jgi:hypothetical protein
MKFTNTPAATPIRAEDAKLGVLYKHNATGWLLMKLRPCTWQNSENDVQRAHFVVIQGDDDEDSMNTCIMEAYHMLTPMGRPTFTFPE